MSKHESRVGRGGEATGLHSIDQDKNLAALTVVCFTIFLNFVLININLL
jgi:hypothetical protein